MIFFSSDILLWSSFISWVWQTEIGNYRSFFALLPLPLPPPKNLKNQNFEKMSKSGDIILHMCTTNDDHMMYGSWDMEHDRQNFLSFIFLDHFLP